MTYGEMLEEVSMLEVDINRMCVINNRDELFHEYEFAKKRLEFIYQYNLSRIDVVNDYE